MCRCLQGRWMDRSGDLQELGCAKTYEKTFALEEEHHIRDVDFSPDSTRLDSASENRTAATVWGIATRQRALTLHHKNAVITAKFSPQGDRTVRVYDSKDGRLLVDLAVKVTAWYSTSFLWSSQRPFVVSDSKIKHIEAPTGSSVSELPVSEGSRFSCIALSQHGELIAYPTNRAVNQRFGTRRHTDNLVSSNVLKTCVESRSHKTTGLSQLVEGAGESPSNIYLASLQVSYLFLYITAYLNNPLAAIVPHKILVSTPFSRSQTFRSRTLFSVYGSTITSRTRKHH